jgi:hypothetical protein
LVASHGDNDNQAWIAGNGYIFTRNGLAVGGTGEGQGIGNAVIAYDGSATFESFVRVNRDDIKKACFQASNPNGVNGTIYSNGDALFNGKITASNVTFSLDTGGVLDVKERIQNTQAILYRLKAALIQPDADANQLRTRLLEALDILTSDGDES